MNQFQASEEANEMYLIPGTKQVISWDSWQEHLIEGFHGTTPGCYVVDNHYVNLDSNGIAHVEDAEFYQKVHGKWTKIFEPGFNFHI